MRPSILILSLFTALIATSAQASPFSYLKNQGFYISSSASISIPTSPDAEVAGINGSVDFNNGAGVTAAVGHHLFDSWRLELEYAYRNNDIDQMAGVKGGLSQHALMINAFYDVNFDHNFFWYAGAGIGFARTRLEWNGADDNDLVFAHQVLTGFGYRLSRQTSFVIGYRIYHTLKQDYNVGGASVELKSPWQHIFELGLRYDF